MIDDKAASRTEQWVNDAVAKARAFTAEKRTAGFSSQPSSKTQILRRSSARAEAFAPLVTIFKVPSFAAGVRKLNDSDFGLQAGVFTNNLERALYAFEQIEAGGVIINDIPDLSDRPHAVRRCEIVRFKPGRNSATPSKT